MRIFISGAPLKRPRPLCRASGSCTSEQGFFLASIGGLLKRLLPLFRLGLGGVVGSGDQYMSWITVTDATRAIEFLIRHESIRDSVNLVAPYPVTNREFTYELGRVLRKPTLAPLSSFIVRLFFGEMGTSLLLGSVRAQPTRLLTAGFEFCSPNLSSALTSLLKGRQPSSEG